MGNVGEDWVVGVSLKDLAPSLSKKHTKWRDCKRSPHTCKAASQLHNCALAGGVDGIVDLALSVVVNPYAIQNLSCW